MYIFITYNMIGWFAEVLIAFAEATQIKVVGKPTVFPPHTDKSLERGKLDFGVLSAGRHSEIFLVTDTYSSIGDLVQVKFLEETASVFCCYFCCFACV